MPNRIRKPVPRQHPSTWIPSSRVEYLYYLIIAYSLVSGYLGIEVPLVAAGAMLALAAFCFQRLGPNAKRVLAPIGFLLACTISFIFIQIAVHGLSVTDPHIRTFILWICGMIFVQSLRLRPGFVQRCTLVLFVLGLIAVPNLRFSTADVVERAAADIQLGGNLQNANGLAGWFGFCMISFAILGLEAKRATNRTLYWLAAAGCLFIVGLTVSRTALLGSAIAITVGFRRLLKRGFLPLLMLIIFSGFIMESGLFGHIVSSYEERGMEETGRFLLWPYVVERILTSPIVGVGASNISTYVPEREDPFGTPHNSFLFFALSSGVLPLAFWSLFWIRAWFGSFSHIDRSEYDSFRMPFLLYLFVGSMFGDVSIDPWVLVAFALAAGKGISNGRKGLVRRLRRRRTAQSLGPASKAANL